MLAWLRLLADRITGRVVGSAEDETTPKAESRASKPGAAR